MTELDTSMQEQLPSDRDTLAQGGVRSAEARDRAAEQRDAAADHRDLMAAERDAGAAQRDTEVARLDPLSLEPALDRVRRGRSRGGRNRVDQATAPQVAPAPSARAEHRRCSGRPAARS